MNKATLFLFLACNCLHAYDMIQNEHPFLADDPLPNWQTLTPEHIESDINYAIADAQRNIDAIAQQDLSSLTFENTILALEHATDMLDRGWERVSHLDSVCNSEALRVEYNKMLPVVVEFSSNIILNDALWERIRTYSESENAKQLPALEKRLLKRVVDSFRDSGADLPREQRERLKSISLELSQKSQKFSENCLDSRNAWEKYLPDSSLLSGLPEIALNILADDAKQHKHSGYRLSLQAPSLGPCMQYLDDDNLRKELFEASRTVGRGGKYDNLQNVTDILRLRDEEAKILGHKTFADLALKHRMAKNGAHAMKFIEDLHDRTEKYFQRDVKELRTFIRNFTGNRHAELQPWNCAYYAKKNERARFDFDDEELRPYFKMEDVVSGLFELAHRLYGIRIQECKTFYSEDPNAATPSDAISVWHPDVKFYNVFEKTGKYIGGFYADWYPRPSKRGGAWTNGLVSGENDKDGQWRCPVGTICGSLTPSTETTPSLLTHYEVETIFHEFGHLLHHLFGHIKYAGLNGTHVAWDFVELPSQIMENFCWERVSLDLFAKHYQTGEKLPDELFNKMTAVRKYMASMGMMRQLSLAKLDLELHQNYPAYKNCDIESKLQDVLQTYRVNFPEPVPTITLEFGHIFSGGYAAGYYSYKWAEVLDADAFTKFLANGIISAEVGHQFREKILSRGDSQDADVLYRDFMGRDPSLEPLLIRSGMVDE
ncbi:MAG: M3 family metallopeptidase [Opitutales bacterium]|nr:M3 family metallopeptidase [Opitutales bacterium]